MTYPSPIQKTLEQFELSIDVENETENRAGAATGTFQSQALTEFLAWGDDGCFVVATTGVVELEYAAIRKGAGVFDAPCRGTIKLTGEDRLTSVGSLITQKVDDMKVGDVLLGFITNRKGKIVADVIIRVLCDQVLLDVDINVTQQLCDHLKSYIVMEDVSIENITAESHWLWCLGTEINNLAIDGSEVHPLPIELLGVEAVAFLVNPEEAVSAWELLLEQGCKPIGWYALNMARVEQGIPIFMIDFDTSNLPHETSLLSSRVRFDKGCYLGQEIIARMESLGQPKQKIIKLEMQSDTMPISGSQLWADETTSGTPIGVVTSSAISPKHGLLPVVIAMVGKKYNTDETKVFTHVGNEVVEATVKPL
jgi:folate-binding protein YgfZ